MVPTIKMCCHPIPWMLKFVWLLKCFLSSPKSDNVQIWPPLKSYLPWHLGKLCPCLQKKTDCDLQALFCFEILCSVCIRKKSAQWGVWEGVGGGFGGHAFFAAHLYPCCNYRCIASSCPGLSWFTVWQLYKYHWLKIHMGTAVVIKCNKRLIEEINFNKISLKQQYK